MAPRAQASRAPSHDLVDAEVVRLAAQVLAQLALGEGAELTLEVADVRVVDVAVDHVGHDVAVDLAAEVVGGPADVCELVPPRLEEPRDLRLRQRLPGAGPLDEGRDGGTLLEAGTGLGLRERVLRGRGQLRAWRPRLAAREAAGVHRAEGGRRHRRRQPAAVVGGVGRVDGEPLDQVLSRRLGLLAQLLEVGPRRLGIDVVDRHGRDAAPVAQTCGHELAVALGAEVGWGLHAHLRPEEDAGDRERPEEVVEVGFRRVLHLRARLRPEVLDDELLDVAIAIVEVAQRQERLDTLPPRLSDADEDARGERHRQLAGEPDRLDAGRRVLIGGAVVHPALLQQAWREALQHDPLRDRHLAQGRDVVGGHHARIHVREQSGLFGDERGHLTQVRDRGLVSKCRQLLARDLVAQLGLVPEREQRLRAPRLRARTGGRKDLVGCHVRALSRSRGLREGAVVADVPAELRQRDEDVAGIRDEVAVAGVTERPRCGGERVQVRQVSEREGLVLPRPLAPQRAFQHRIRLKTHGTPLRERATRSYNASESHVTTHWRT